MLMVLLLGLADFGRVFAAGITVEAAARNAAETAAQEYLQLVRNKAGGSLDTADYASIHRVALDSMCNEAETLPNHQKVGSTCTMPLAAVCVHDGTDPVCGVEADPAVWQCDDLNGPWDATNQTDPDDSVPGTPLPYVEVRVCYQFTTLFNITDLSLPLGWSLNLGQIWLEKGREFAVANY